MKNTALLILAIGFSFASFSQNVAKASKAKVAQAPAAPITFKSTTITRNDIKAGTDDMFSFSFTNTGKTPILVQGVATSCGCTTANKPEGPVAPGKTAEISVKYDTKRMGAFEKTITVTTNVSDPIVLTIKGNVLSPETTGEGSGLAH